MALILVGGFWLGGVCADVIDPLVHQGEQAFGAPVRQLAEWDVGAFVGKSIFSVQPGDAQSLEVGDQSRTETHGAVRGRAAHPLDPDFQSWGFPWWPIGAKGTKRKLRVAKRIINSMPSR